MIGNAEFYRLYGCLSAGMYPLRDGTETPFHTVQNVKFRDGMQTQIDVPSFTGIHTVNMCKLNGRWYWITSCTEKTAANGQYTMTLEYAGPTDMFIRGDTIGGTWKRTPYLETDYLSDTVSDDIVVIKQSNNQVGSLVTYNDKPLYFWHIAGYDAQNNIRRFCGFFTYDPDTMTTERVIAAVYPDPNDEEIPYYYPDFEDLFKDINGNLGILAENVIDFSISVRLPYLTYVYERGGYYYAQIDNYAGVSPTDHGSNGLYSYELSPTELVPYGSDEVVTAIRNMDAVKRLTGRFSVMDWNGNNIMDIPSQLCETDPYSPDDKRMALRCQTICDINGIYSILRVGDMVVTVPEGKLPYNSDTWDTYKAYQMDTDRTAMQNSIIFSEHQSETDRIMNLTGAIAGGAQTGIMTGIMAGNPMAAVAGVPFGIIDAVANNWQRERSLELSKMQAQADFDLSQKRAVNQPQSSFNAGYGMIYCALNALRPMKLCYWNYKNMTDDKLDDYFFMFGYPAEGTFDIEGATTGYYKGMLVAATGAGQFYDRTNEIFMNGFRFV